jgi:hypothetical protein
MKKIIIFLLLLLFRLQNVEGQSLNLTNILKEAYSKESDLSVISGEEVDYIVPPSIAFLDTILPDKNKLTFKLVYFKNQKLFEDHLRQAHSVSVLSIVYNKIYDGTLEITLSVAKTKDSQYFGAHRFYTFVDRRTISLIYNKQKNQWEYGSLLKLGEEPQVGHN